MFNGTIRIQSLGRDASLYGGQLVTHAGEKRLQLRYGDWDLDNLPVEELSYLICDSGLY